MNLRLRLLNWVLHTFEKPRLAQTSDPILARKHFHDQRFLFYDPPFTTYLPDSLGSVPAIWVSRRVRSQGLLLYFHGGAYLMGSPATHRGMVARLASLIGVPALLPDYRKAPEHPFPAAFEDAWTAWQAVLARGYPPESIILGGDSAGGGLALALLSRICMSGGPRPAAVFACSPWTDLTLSGASMVENASADHLLPASRTVAARDSYLAGADPADPRASPLFAKFPNCPPVLLQAAKTEILRDDAKRMAEVLRAEGAEVALDLLGDLPHVWTIFQGWLPEADDALTRTADFTTARLHAPKPADS